MNISACTFRMSANMSTKDEKILLQQASTTREAGRERYKIHPPRPGPPEEKKEGAGSLVLHIALEIAEFFFCRHLILTSTYGTPPILTSFVPRELAPAGGHVRRGAVRDGRDFLFIFRRQASVSGTYEARTPSAPDCQLDASQILHK